MCFDAACQAAQDRAFVAAVLFPLVASVAAGVFVWKSPRAPSPRREGDEEQQQQRQQKQRQVDKPVVSFEDPATGMVFEGDTLPERDRSGKLALRAFSFTPVPVEQGSPGERIRVDVGEVGNRSPRTYVFETVLATDSKIVAVTLPRPAGVVFAEKKEKKLLKAGAEVAIVVDEILDGSPAQKRLAAAKLDPSLEDSALVPGDVLRGFTTTNFVFRGAGLALLGAGLKPPAREVVVYGADGQSFPNVKAALQRGDSSDGDMTIIVERRRAKREGEDED